MHNNIFGFGNLFDGIDPLRVRSAAISIASSLLSSPTKMAKYQYEYIAELSGFMADNKFCVGNKSEPISDLHRLNLKYFNHIINNEGAHLNQSDAKHLKFFSKLVSESVAPENFPFSNQSIIKEFFSSGGVNAIKGWHNLINDMQKGYVSTVDTQQFIVGKTLATTPGRVVFRNRLFELIHYKPTTEQVYETPVLVIPPWINKFYVLDLSEHNSFVRWMLANNNEVYMISWVNPDCKIGDIRFSDYLQHGALQAWQYVSSRHKQMQIIGYCIGGTLLATMLAYLEATSNTKNIVAATFLASLIDFKDIGEFAALISEEQIEAFENRVRTNGCVSGLEIYAMFSMMRAKDMIWKPAIGRYMYGNDAPSIDILYWNADPTNLPAEMSIFYLRNMYLQNKLAKPNRLAMCGVPIDVRKITTPSFFLAASKDHIVPWKGAYKGALLWPNSTFVLTSSGHVAGIVNPPQSSQVRNFWSNDTLDIDHEVWLERAKQEDGSWWMKWLSWCKPKLGELVKPAKMERGLCKAPGEYVTKRIL